MALEIVQLLEEPIADLVSRDVGVNGGVVSPRDDLQLLALVLADALGVHRADDVIQESLEGLLRE